MMSFSLSGGVEIVGFISPTDPLDTYPVIDPWNGTITDWSLFNTGSQFSGGSGNCITELYVENIHSCNTGITIHNNVTPVTDNTIDLGKPLKRFRDINTVNGTSSIWTSTTKVNTPQVDLGLDSLGNSRIITANSSVIQNDTLNGGTF
jgi:hypothetical protein